MNYQHTMKRNLFSIVMIAVLIGAMALAKPASATPAPYPGGVHWVSMPVRSASQMALGMNGGEGGQCTLGMSRCASDDNRIYIDIDVCGVWRSDNGGAFWHPCRMAGLNNTGTTCVAVSPTNHDVVLTYSANDWMTWRAGFVGIYRSTDGGDTWNRTLTTPNMDGNPLSHPVLSFASNGTRVYLGSYTAGIFRSDDGGATWVATGGLTTGTINRVVVDPSNPDKVWAGTSAGLQVSTDKGVTWTAKTATNINVPDVSPDPLIANRVYCIFSGTGLERSNDGGTTWTFVGSGNGTLDGSAKRVFASPIDSVHMILASVVSSRVSADGGATWQDFVVDTSKTFNGSNAWGQDGSASWSYMNANNVVETNSCVMYASTDGGVHWGDSSTGFTGFFHQWSQTAVALAYNDPNRIAMFCDDMNTSLTYDDGSTWINKRLGFNITVNGGYGSYAGDMNPNWTATPTIINASGAYFRDDLMRSTTGNSNAPDWVDTAATVSDHKFIRYDIQNSNIVYADNMRSNDDGQTWSTLTQTVRGMSTSNGSIVYAYSGGGVMKSTDTGNTWAALPAPPVATAGAPGPDIIIVDPVNTNKIWIIDGPDMAMFNGTSWTSYPVSTWAAAALSPVVNRIAVDPTNGNKVAVGLDVIGVSHLFYSSDGGVTWYDITGDSPQIGSSQTLHIQPITGRIIIGQAFGTYTTFLGTPSGGDITAPTAPTNLAAPSQTTSTVNLTWTAATDNVAVRAYDIYNGSYLVASTPGTSYTVCGLTANAYTFKVVARDNANNQTSSSPLVVTIGAAATAIPQTSTAPVIDGAVDSVWSASASHSINNVAGIVSSGADLSGSWQALWDTTNLYVLVSVTDDVLMRYVTNPWDGDSVELYIDADNSRNTTYDSNDFQYAFPWNGTTAVETKHSPASLTGVTFGQVTTGTNYRIEIKIPWSTLTVSAALNNPIGIDVHIDDADTTPGTRDGKKMWNDTTDMAWSNPNLFGTGQLTAGTVTAPPAPTGLIATGGNAQVALTWTASSGATTYNVLRSTVSGSGYASVTTGVAVTNYTNTGLTNGTTYYFVVSATNAGGTSGNSTQASAIPQVSAPPAPTGLIATGGNAQVALTWTASSGATTYNVLRSTVNGSGYASVATGIAVTNYTNTGLTNGTTYYFVVSATNAGGTSANSTQASAVPTAGSSGNTHGGTWALQGIPTGTPAWKNTWQTSSAASSATYTASFWMKGTGGENLYIYNGAWGTEITHQTFIATATWTQYSYTIATGANTQLTYVLSDSTTSAGTLYIDDCFLGILNGTNVLANPGFESGAVSWNVDVPSTWTILQPGGSAPPPAPTGLSATAGNTQITLGWIASTGATSYNVKRSTINGSGYATISSPATTSYINTGLTNGTTYYYVVTAVGTGGESGNSNQASATPVGANTHGGTWGVKAIITTTPAWTNFWQIPSGVAASSTYTASFWMKGSGGVILIVYAGNWGTELKRQTFTATATWAQYSFTIPTGSNTQLTYVVADGSGIAGTLYIDDCFLGILNGTNILGSPGFEGGTGWNTAAPFSILQNP